MNRTGLKARIARTTGYVEVAAHIFTLLGLDNMSRITLDGMPVISLPEKSDTDDGEVPWLNNLTSMQFSLKEREIGNAPDCHGVLPSLHVNLKETIFTMFILSSGLQGGQTGIFTLDTTYDKDAHMVFFVRYIQLDGAVGSVVLEAAILPLDKELMRTNRDLRRFMVLLLTVDEIC